MRRADGALERLEPRAPALGLMPGARFEPALPQLAAGDLLLGYTDGVTEAAGPAGTFGEARLVDLLASGAGGAEGLLARIVDAVDAHGAGAQPHDDMTLLALQAGGALAGASRIP